MKAAYARLRYSSPSAAVQVTVTISAVSRPANQCPLALFQPALHQHRNQAPRKTLETSLEMLETLGLSQHSEPEWHCAPVPERFAWPLRLFSAHD